MTTSVPATNLQANPKYGVLEYGFWLFLLVAVGRIGELVPGLGSLPLAKLAIAAPLILRIARRRTLPGLTPTTRPLARICTALAIISIVLTPFSFWPGACVDFVTQFLLVLVAVVSITYALSYSWPVVKRTFFVLVLCGAILTRAALAAYSGGRAATDTMYDTNDLAYVLVTVLPLAVGFVICARSKIHRLLYAAVTASLGAAALLTQSRGGFLALIAVVLFLTFTPILPPEAATATGARKRTRSAWLLIGVITAGVVTWSNLPQAARDRFATVLDLGHDYNLDPREVKGRGQIWSRGFQAALARPVGYGPSTFPGVDGKFGGRYNAPHNSFLQVLVELGVVGLLLFLRMYYLAVRGLQRARAQTMTAAETLTASQREQVVFGRMLQASLVGNAVAAFFLSMAYVPLLWCVIGLCMAMMGLADRGTGATPAAAPASQD